MTDRPGLLVFMAKDEGLIQRIKNYSMTQDTRGFYEFTILLRAGVLMLQSPAKGLLDTCDY